MKYSINFYFFYLLITSQCLFAQQSKIKVACIGNSITAGYLLNNPQIQSYPSQLQIMLGDSYQVANFGHSGATLLKNGHRPYYKTKEFENILSFAPDIAIIHLGLNDTDPRNWPNYKDEFQSDYAWLIASVRHSNPKVKIFISQLSPIFNEHPRFKSGTRDWYDQIQMLIPSIAKANQTGLIDLTSPLYKRPDLFADNLHPNTEGAEIIAKTVYQKITGDFGGLKMFSIFTDNMVLQRNKPIKFYGVADKDEKVEVLFNLQKRQTKADENGNWQVIFPQLPAGGNYQVFIQTAKKKIELKNLTMGDVWLCAGQSNMAFELKNTIGAKPVITQAANYKNLRLFKYKPLVETTNVAWDSLTLDKVNKLQYFSGHWDKSSPESAADFSAVAFAFGKKISIDENIPIGLIQVAVGGSPTESWIDRYTLTHDNQLVDVLYQWRKSDFVQDFCRNRAAVNLKNTKNPRQRHPYEPAYNYESGIDSLTRFPISGVLWYQGESNTHNLEFHESLFKTLVSSWRAKWNEQFPFYFVQLSAIDRPSWTYFRNSQRLLQKLIPNTFMAVCSDLGDSLDVHPKHKLEVGKRLALLAQKNTYHKKIQANGPEINTAKLIGNKIILSFTNATQLHSAQSKKLIGFELVNSRGQYIPVDAIIVGQRNVQLQGPKNEEILKVCYAWKAFNHANLINEVGLPASTFSIKLTK